MASVGESDCHKDPKFAVICSFIDKYGELLGLPAVTYSELRDYMEDTSNDVSKVLIDIHIRLLRRIGKSNVTADRFEKSIIKFCHHFSEFDAWEVESYGYKHAKLATKLTILKNLMECQFDFNVKFKEKVNESSAEDMRFLPIGRDKEGQAYWYFLDKDLNLLVYKEEQDDEDADTWQLVCSDRQELANLVSNLQNNAERVKEEDDKSSDTTRSSKEGSPNKEIGSAESVQVKLERIETKEEILKDIKKDDSESKEKSVCQKNTLGTNGEQKAEKVSNDQQAEKKEGVDQEKTTTEMIISLPHQNKNVQDAEIKKEVPDTVVIEGDAIKSEVSIQGDNSKISNSGNEYDEKVNDSDNKTRTNEQKHIVEDLEPATHKDPLEPDKNGKNTEIEVVKEQDSAVNEKKDDALDITKKISENESKIGTDTEPTAKTLKGEEKHPEENSQEKEETAVLQKEKTDAGASKESIEIQEKMEAGLDKQAEMKSKEGSDSMTENVVEDSDNKTKKDEQSSTESKKNRLEDDPSSSDRVEKVLSQTDADKKSPESISVNDSRVEEEMESGMETNSDCHSSEAITNCISSSSTELVSCVKSNPPDADTNTHPHKHPPDKEALQEKDDLESNLTNVGLDRPEKDRTEVSVVKDNAPENCEKMEVDMENKVSEGKESENVTEKDVSEPEKENCGKSDSDSASTHVSTEIEKSSSPKQVVPEPIVKSAIAEESAKTTKAVESVKTSKLEEMKSAKDEESETTADAVESVKTAEAAESVKSAKEEESVKTREAEESVKTAMAEESVKSTKMVESVKPSEAEQSVNLAGAEESVEPQVADESVKSTEMNESVKQEETVKPPEAEEGMKSTETEESVKPSEAEKSVKPPEAGENVKPAEIDESMKSAEIEKDVKPQRLEESAEPPDAEIGVKVGDDGQTNNDIKEMENKVEVDKKTGAKDGQEKAKVADDVKDVDGKNLDIEKSTEVHGDVTDVKADNSGENKEGADGKIERDSVKECSKPETDKTALVNKEVSEKGEINKEGNEEFDTTKINAQETRETVIGETSAGKGEESGNAKDSQGKTEEAATKDTAEVDIEKAKNVGLAENKRNEIDNAEIVCDENGHSEISKPETDKSVDAKAEEAEKQEGDKFNAAEAEDMKTTESVVSTTAEAAHIAQKETDQGIATKPEMVEKSNTEKDEGLEKGKEVGNASETGSSAEVCKGENEEEKRKENKDVETKKIETSPSLNTNQGENDTKDSSEQMMKVDDDAEKKTENHKTTQKATSTTNEIPVCDSTKSLVKEGEDKINETSGSINSKALVNGDIESTSTTSELATDSVAKPNEGAEKKSEEKSPTHSVAKLNEGSEKKSEEKSQTEKEGETGESGKSTNELIPSPAGAKNGQDEVKETEEKTDSTNTEAKTANGETQRNLKRAAPEPCSDEQVKSEPNGKRARQATKTQKTRGGRNAAARGRAARLDTKDTESDDSETAVTPAKGRGRGRGRGRGGRMTRGRATPGKTRSSVKEDEEEENASDQTAEKRAKKKKSDSNSEALSEEEVTPAKKGRSQAQVSAKSTGGKARGGKASSKKATPKSAPAKAEEDKSGIRRSLRVRQLKARRPPTPSSPSEESSEDTEESEETEEEDHDTYEGSFTPEEESGDEDFKPKGRNFQRQAARTINEKNEELVNDDTPCVKCGKYNHPEMILLCDKCDAGYHTACLRPPLMLIPDGDWFCPPCEHSMLVSKLLECLQNLDVARKKKDRLYKRQERLAYVGISISNILHGDRKGPVSELFDTDGKKIADEDLEDGENGNLKQEEEEEVSHSSSYESEQEEPKHKFRSERLAKRQAQKRSYRAKHKRRRPVRAQTPEGEVFAKRTCRARNTVSYQFKEFDELISNAIEDDKPCRREKPPESDEDDIEDDRLSERRTPPGISRGKDMSNILGASDEEEEMIRQRDGDSGLPPPVVRKKPKRKLTMLDSDEDEAEEEDSEEFKLTEDEDSEATEGEEEGEDEEALNSEDSNDWKPQKNWSNSRASSRRNRGVKNFVVEDEDYDTDEDANKRRSARKATRNSSRGRISYNDWESDEEETEEEASFSDYSSEDFKPAPKVKKTRGKRPAPQSKKKRKGKLKSEEESEESPSDSSIARKRKLLRKLVKKRRKDESESEDSEESTEDHRKGKVSPRKKKQAKSESESEFTVEEDSGEDSEESPRFKKKNVLRSSEEEEEEPEGAEKKGQSKSSDQVPETAVGEAKVDNEVEGNAEIVSPKTRGKGRKAGAAQAVRGNKKEPAAPETQVPPPEDAPKSLRSRKAGLAEKEKEASVEEETLSPPMEPNTAGGRKKQAAQRQRKKSREGPEEAVVTQEGKMLAAKNAGQLRGPKDKPAGGKKKKVPNFLDVPSGGEESDEQKADQNVDSSAPAQPLSQESGQTRTPMEISQPAQPQMGAVFPQSESHNFQRNFPPHNQQPHGHGQQFGQGPGQYQFPQASQGMPPYQQGQPRPQIGSPPQSSGAPTPQNGPPPSTTFPGSQHPNFGPQHQMGQLVRPQHPGYGAGPMPNHSFPPNVSQGHPSGETGQVPPNVSQKQQHMGHPPFQGGPPHSSAGQTPPRGHPSPHGMVPGTSPQQHNSGMRPPFHMGQQPPQSVASEMNHPMGGYPQNYGPGRMPSPREMGPGQGMMGHAYYGMRSPPPHGMGQHFPNQYHPHGMPPHAMSSPLTSMGQMAKNIGQGASMQSPPPTSTPSGVEGSRDKPMAMGSSPHQDMKAKPDKPREEGKHLNSENAEEDVPIKAGAKEGSKKKGKSKNLIGDTNAPAHAELQVDHSGKTPATKALTMYSPHAQDTTQIQGQPPHPGLYRPPNQTYNMNPNMPPYQMPYMHRQHHPMARANMPHPHAPPPQGSFLPPGHPQQGPNMPLNQQRTTVHGNGQDVDQPAEKIPKGNVAEGVDAPSSKNSNNEQRSNMPPYQQNPQLPVGKGHQNQTAPSSSPGHQGTNILPHQPSSDLPSSQQGPVTPNVQGPTSQSKMLPTQHGSTMPPTSQGPNMPPNSQAPNMPPNSQAPNMPPNSQAPNMPPNSQAPNMPPNSQAPNMPPSTHGHMGQTNPQNPGLMHPQGMMPDQARPQGPYFNSGPYYPPYGAPHVQQPNAWAQNVHGYGPRFDPNMYAYRMGLDHMNQGPRMPQGMPPRGMQGPPHGDMPATTKANAQDGPPSDQVPNTESRAGPVMDRRLSSESQLTSPSHPHKESGSLEQGRASESGPSTDLLPPGLQNKQKTPQSSSSSSAIPASSSSTSAQSSSSDTVNLAPSASESIRQSSGSSPPTSVSKLSNTAMQSSTESQSPQKTGEGVSSSHQASPAMGTVPPTTWSGPGVPMQYPQHMGQWPGMGAPGQYGAMRPYGGPGMGQHPHFPGGPNQGQPESQPGHHLGPMPGHPGQMPGGQGQFMHPGFHGYEAGFRPPHGGRGPVGPGADYHGMGSRPRFGPGYKCPPQMRPQMQEFRDGRSPGLKESSLDSDQGGGREDQIEGNAAPKPKRAKTQKKSAKDGSVPARGKGGKGKGRGRGGFMIDNLLQSQRGEGEEEADDSAEIKDIVSYVTTDEYFKQQTSS